MPWSGRVIAGAWAIVIFCIPTQGYSDRVIPEIARHTDTLPFPVNGTDGSSLGSLQDWRLLLFDWLRANEPTALRVLDAVVSGATVHPGPLGVGIPPGGETAPLRYPVTPASRRTARSPDDPRKRPTWVEPDNPSASAGISMPATTNSNVISKTREIACQFFALIVM
jgi:hypothetical protein